MSADDLRISVIVPTYKRAASVERLLRQLSDQTLPSNAYEVIVVDDGSPEDPRARLRDLQVGYEVVLERQPNGGAASARNRGASLARAPIILFLDDDMQIGPDLLRAHLAIHDREPRAVVLGFITPDPQIHLDLFERFHADVLERFGNDVLSGKTVFRGPNVYTGNVSMRRDAYLRVGGFDTTLGHSEDAELGIRLEKDGATFHVSKEGGSVHSSDRASVDGWRRRAKLYGHYDSRISKKHPDAPHANPWRYFRELSLASRPMLALAVAAPRAGSRLADVALSVSNLLDRVGLERLALRGATVTFGVEYARGLREEAGSLGAAIDEMLAFADQVEQGGRGWRTARAARRLREAVRADHATMLRYDGRYSGGRGSIGPAGDAVVRIGFQMMIAVRLMHFCRDAGAVTAAKAMSRFIRHAYGSDIHWDAQFAPGVQIVHGMGLAISGKARVERDVILFQHVTLGESSGGAPHVNAGAHVGPGATLLGPIQIGERTKIMAGSVLRESVAPDSIVSSPDPAVRPRAEPRSGAASGTREEGTGAA